MWHFIDFEVKKIKGVSFNRRAFYLVFSNSWQIIGDIRFVKNKAVPPCYVGLLNFLGSDSEIAFDSIADKIEIHNDSNGKPNWLFIYVWGNAMKHRFNIAVGSNNDKNVRKSYFDAHLRHRGKRKSKAKRRTDIEIKVGATMEMLPPY